MSTPNYSENLTTQDRPRPDKQRKALTDMDSEVNRSPHYNNPKMVDTTRKPPLSFGQGANAALKTRIRVPSAVVVNPSMNRRVSSVPLSTRSSVSEQLKNIVKEHKSSNTTATRKKGAPSYTSYQDPAALRRQFENQESLRNKINVEMNTLRELEKEIEELKQRERDVEKRKDIVALKVSSLKQETANAQVEIHRTERMVRTAEEEQRRDVVELDRTMTMKLTDDQRAMAKELNVCEEKWKAELSKALAFDDEPGKKEIEDLEEILNQLLREVSVVREANEVTYGKERERLTTILEESARKEEKKCEQATDSYETAFKEKTRLHETLQKIQDDVNAIVDEVEELDEKIEKETQIKASGETDITKVMSDIEVLESQNTELQKELEQAMIDADAVDTKYQESVTKTFKETQFRKRIENSIEDLLGKLRVYARVLPSETSSLQVSHSEQDPSKHLLTLDGESFAFNKVFTSELSEHEVSSETFSLVENVMNGCNVSIIVTGADDCTLTSALIKSCLSTLKTREERYTDKVWEFQYNAQAITITTEGVIDTVTSDTASIKLENRTINSSAKTFPPYSTTFESQTPENSSTLIKISIAAKSPHKSFKSSLYILNLSRIESFDLIYNTTTKVSQNKFSTSEFEHSMYQLVHSLYSNTKVATICNVEDTDSEETKKWLELCNFVTTVNAPPVKRVYSKMSLF